MRMVLSIAVVKNPNTINRRLLAVLLDRWGCRYTEVENGEKALNELKAAVDVQDPYHIALLDMQWRL